MVEIPARYPNYFLVGSKRKYLIGNEEGAWRGGAMGADVLSSPLYTGDVELLWRAHSVRDTRIVLETRLDADGGLVTGYIKYVQESAVGMFVDVAAGRDNVALPDNFDNVREEGAGKEGSEEAEAGRVRPQWMYWCAKTIIEWFADPRTDVGEANAIQHSKLCVTPGITVGFPVGTPYGGVPQHEHAGLLRNIERDGGCGLPNNSDCLTMVRKFPMMAVRSRTVTSAGMMGIEMDPKDALAREKREMLWALLKSHNLYITEEDVRRAKSFLRDNVVEIAMDNLKGKCTNGHSFKVSCGRIVLSKIVRATKAMQQLKP